MIGLEVLLVTDRSHTLHFHHTCSLGHFNIRAIIAAAIPAHTLEAAVNQISSHTPQELKFANDLVHKASWSLFVT